jgi:hypothetical protein
MATTVTLKPNAIDISGSTSGTTTLQATAVAGTTTLTLPAATDTLVGKATTDTLTNKTLTGAVMNGTLGATTPSTVAATTLTTSSTVTHNGGTANGVAYLDGSKVLTTGSGLVFDGTNFSTTGTIKGSTTIGVGNATPSTSGAGITFPATQSASTDANTLDDYEEGTWTPRLADAASGGTSNTSGSSGWYTKIGNQVTIYGKFDPMTTTGFTASNQLWVRDLPFPSANTMAITPGYANVDNITYAGDHPIPYLQTSTSGFRLRSNTSGSAGTLILVSSVTSGSAWIYFVVTYQV